MFIPTMKAGGTIALISPGRWVDEAALTRIATVLSDAGFKVVLHPQNYLRHGQLAGTDKDRANAIDEVFSDKSIDGIMAARGGTGSIFLLPHINMEAVRGNPKPLIGFSDVTVLLNAISKQCGFATYHGPLGWTFGVATDTDLRTIKFFSDVITGKLRSIEANAHVARAGHAEGRLIGGNITRLQSLIGTNWDWSAEGGILFIEDVDEVIYRLDQVLCHFAFTGKFKNLKAVLVGEMVRIGDGETGYAHSKESKYGQSWREIVSKWVPPDVPLAFDVPCGHGGYLTTLPVGADVRLVAADDKIKIDW